MADDITLTVRVRDLTQGDFTRLNGRLQRMRQSLSQVGSSGRTASVASTRLGNDIDRLGNSFQRMRNEGSLSSAEMTRMRTSLRGMSRDARTAMRAGDITRQEFRNLRTEIRGMSRDMGRLDDGSIMRRLGNGVRDVGNRFSGASHFMKIFLVILLLLGPAAQAIGALLITALAGSFIALGAFALRGSADVKNAFSSMKSTIGSVVREAAQPLEGPLVSAMGNVANAARGMGPTLRQAFEATGPLVDNVFGAITDLAAAALPGMTAALQSAGPAMEGFRQAMGEVGQGIGDMFKKMAVGNENGLADAWRLMGNELQNLLTNLGEFIANMSKSASASALFIGIMRSFSGILHIVEAAFKAIDAVASPLFKKINSWVQGTSGLTGASKNLTNSFQYMGMSSVQLKDKLSDVQDKIKEINKNGKYLSGPARKLMNDDAGLPGLLDQEAALKLALAGATDKATAANKAQVTSIKDLIAATQQLNETNRSNLDARAAQQQSIIDAKKEYKKYGEALTMTNGQLDLTTQSSITAYGLLSKISSSTNDATKAAVDAKRPWSEVQAIWKNGNTNLTAMADGMGLTKEQAELLAAQMLNMPSPTIDFKANTAQAVSDLQSFISQVQNSPGSKSVTLQTLSARAEAILTNFGYKVQRLPNGSVRVTAATGTAASNIETIRNMLAALDGTSATTYIESVNTTVYRTKGSVHDVVGATGGMASSLRKFAGGGSISGGVLDGPGTKTSDDIFARLSRGEFVMRAAAVDKYGPGFMQKINNGLYDPRKVAKFAKGGKVSKTSQATKDARNELKGSFGISELGRYAGYQRTPFERSLAVPGDVGSLVSNLNKAISDIRKAFSGKTEKHLVNSLTSAGKALIRQQKNLDKVNKSLEKAKTKLDDLKQSAAQLKDSVTTGVLSATNVTQVANGDGNVTMRDVMAQMRTGVDKSTAFSSALTQLKAKGVSKDIIGQISEAGISGGGLETAGAILAGSSSEIQTLNEMQAKITAAAGTAGKTASDAMYAAGIKAADGLVKGLQKKQDAIEAAMLKIAKSMEKAIKRALGIKSPSKVMEKVGHFTAEGFAVGMEKNSSVDTAWSSMLGTSSGAGTSGASAGGGVYTIPIYVGGKFLDEVVLDTNRRLVRTRGGDVQKVFGR